MSWLKKGAGAVGGHLVGAATGGTLGAMAGGYLGYGAGGGTALGAGDAWDSLTGSDNIHNPEHYVYDESHIDAARQQQGAARGDQAWLAAQYQDMIEGRGPSLAQSQLRDSTAENQQMAMAMARSGSGPMGQAAAQYDASRNMANTQQQANRQAAMLRAQEHAAAMSGMSAHSGGMRGQDIALAGQEQGYQTDKANTFGDTQRGLTASSTAYANNRQGGVDRMMGIATGGIPEIIKGFSDENMKRAPLRLDSDERKKELLARIGASGQPQEVKQAATQKAWAEYQARAWSKEIVDPWREPLMLYKDDTAPSYTPQESLGEPSNYTPYQEEPRLSQERPFVQEWGYELSPQEREALRRRQIQEGRDKYGHEEALGTAMREYYDPNAAKAQEDAGWANYIQQELANPLRQRPTDPAKAAAWEAYMGPMGDDGLGLTEDEKKTLDMGEPPVATPKTEAPKTEVSSTAKKKKAEEEEKDNGPVDNSSFGQGQKFGAALGGLIRGTSDKDAKGKPKAVEGSDMDAFMRQLKAEAFRYKEDSGEDPDRDFVGVMAQEVEKTPVGSTLVVDGDDGYKQLDVTHGFGTTLAALGRLAERLDKLEKGKGKKNG